LERENDQGLYPLARKHSMAFLVHFSKTHCASFIVFIWVSFQQYQIQKIESEL